MRFTIEDEPQRFVFIGYRLVAACHVNDGKTPHPQADASARIKAVAIGSAVDDGLGHFYEQAFLGCSMIGVGYSTNAAHGGYFTLTLTLPSPKGRGGAVAD